MRRLSVSALGIGLSVATVQPAQAQLQTPRVPVSGAAIDPATVPMPQLAFTPTAQQAQDFDKYFFFHRADTDFATAYADIQECDNYARGMSTTMANNAVPYPYAGTLAGGIGGAIGTLAVDMIFGSAQRRAMRRDNMRMCMGFKEYRAYGLPRDLWTAFNFEEGLRSVDESQRQQMLQMQARAASGPQPSVGEIVE